MQNRLLGPKFHRVVGYIGHGPPKPTWLEGFYGKFNFRWSKPLFFMVFGGSWHVHTQRRTHISIKFQEMSMT